MPHNAHGRLPRDQSIRLTLRVVSRCPTRPGPGFTTLAAAGVSACGTPSA